MYYYQFKLLHFAVTVSWRLFIKIDMHVHWFENGVDICIATNQMQMMHIKTNKNSARNSREKFALFFKNGKHLM